MVISALLLVLLAVALCATGIRFTLGRLGLSPMQTLCWLGLAEIPAPETRRRTTIP